MSTVGERIANIRRLSPKGPNRYGQLYRVAKSANRRFAKVTLYALFVSDDGIGEDSYLVRDHLFESKKEKRSPREWSEWFAKNLAEVHRTGVLVGMSVRTGKTWSVQKIIGWVGDARTSTGITTKRKKPHGRRTPRSKGRKPMAAVRRKRKRNT